MPGRALPRRRVPAGPRGERLAPIGRRGCDGPRVPVGAVTVARAAGFHRCGLRAREAGVGGRWASLPGPSGP